MACSSSLTLIKLMDMYGKGGGEFQAEGNGVPRFCRSKGPMNQSLDLHSLGWGRWNRKKAALVFYLDIPPSLP